MNKKLLNYLKSTSFKDIQVEVKLDRGTYHLTLEEYINNSSFHKKWAYFTFENKRYAFDRLATTLWLMNPKNLLIAVYYFSLNTWVKN